MKKLRGMLWAKVLASVLLFFTILTFFAGGFGLVLFEELGVYGLTAEEVHEKLQNRAMKNDSYHVLAAMPDMEKLQKVDENFRYALLEGSYRSIDEKLIRDDSIWISDNLSEKTDLLNHELQYLTIHDVSPTGEQMGIFEASSILQEAYAFRHSYIYDDYDEVIGSFESRDSYDYEDIMDVQFLYESASTESAGDLGGEPSGKETEDDLSEQVSYTIVSYVNSPMVRADKLKDAGMIEQAEIFSNIVVKMRDWIIVIIVGTAVLGVLLFAFLMLSAGHASAEPDLIFRSWWNRIPLDLHAALVVGISALGLTLYAAVENMRNAPFSWLLFTLALAVIVGYLSVLWYCFSVSINFKAGKWWKNTLIYNILNFLIRTGKKGGGKVFRGIGRLKPGERLKKFRNWLLHGKRHRRLGNWCKKVLFRISYGNRQLKLSVRVKILFVAACLFELFWVFLTIGGIESFFLWLIGWLIEKSVLLWLISRIIYEIAVLQKASEQLAQGDLNYQIDTAGMLSDTRIHGDHLNQIGQGIRQAVSEQMKSERTKTELITNVSHDIKTPLTSIISYTDLLSGLHLQDETANQYIEVLSRQSTRLKKLIEDLIEASKASTGNIRLTMEEVDTEVILDQTIGEFEEKLQNAGVELLVQNQLKGQSQAAMRNQSMDQMQAAEQVSGNQRNLRVQNTVILADSRYLWRIFENLMNNICKYAQPGTRAYVNLTSDGDHLEITFRNISRAQLNISADELMERFVRGDGSRHEEGNGLGLSIAGSLAELMNGKLTLSIDGDLFKAVLTFPTLKSVPNIRG